MEEQLDERDKFLARQGRRILKMEELCEGDVLATIRPKNENLASHDEIKINYVDSIHANPNFLKFNYFPYASLKGPSFNFHISKEEEPIGYYYFSIDPKHAVGRNWYLYEINPNLPREQQETQRNWIKYRNEKEEDERGYVIENEYYKQMGNLIPLIELPILSFLPQSRNPDELVEWIHDAVSEMENLRQVAKNLRKILHC